jgi:drug efflux transport system permease protein
MNGLLRVLLKELIQLRRDKRMIPVLIIGPMVQLLALGFAANTDVTDVPVLVVDLDRTSSSRDLVDRFLGSGYFDLAGAEDSVVAIDPWLLRGRAEVALVIGAGYGEALKGGRAPAVQVIADGTDATSAVQGLGYATRIIARVGADRLRDTLQEAARRMMQSGRPADSVRPGSVELVPRVWYNPDLKSRWFYVPAILALTLMLTTMLLPSMAVVREKEIGTLEQLIVTPIRSWQLILGKLLPFGFIGLIDLVLVTLLVVFLFGVPLRGSFGVLTLLTVPFLMTTLGLGLLVSTLVSNQQQAMMGSTFFLMVPMIYLSGLIFPIENMPIAIQYATICIPLRYYNNVIRGVFLKGSGLAVLWPELVIMTAFGLAALALASLRFRKRLD